MGTSSPECGLSSPVTSGRVPAATHHSDGTVGEDGVGPALREHLLCPQGLALLPASQWAHALLRGPARGPRSVRSACSLAWLPSSSPGPRRPRLACGPGCLRPFPATSQAHCARPRGLLLLPCLRAQCPGLAQHLWTHSGRLPSGAPSPIELLCAGMRSYCPCHCE